MKFRRELNGKDLGIEGAFTDPRAVYLYNQIGFHVSLTYMDLPHKQTRMRFAINDISLSDFFMKIYKRASNNPYINSIKDMEQLRNTLNTIIKDIDNILSFNFSLEIGFKEKMDRALKDYTSVHGINDIEGFSTYIRDYIVDDIFNEVRYYFTNPYDGKQHVKLFEYKYILIEMMMYYSCSNNYYRKILFPKTEDDKIEILDNMNFANGYYLIDADVVKKKKLNIEDNNPETDNDILGFSMVLVKK